MMTRPFAVEVVVSCCRLNWSSALKVYTARHLIGEVAVEAQGGTCFLCARSKPSKLRRLHSRASTVPYISIRIKEGVSYGAMTSLKRSHPSDGQTANLASKVYVRTTRNGKVQKIVRELYLRQDIPCSSKLCSACLVHAPTNYRSKRSSPVIEVIRRNTNNIQHSPLSCLTDQWVQKPFQLATISYQIQMPFSRAWTSLR
jgi:hypothetical protein